MTSTESIAANLSALADRAIAALPSGHTGAGHPLRKDSRIVNGHHVQVLVIGWGKQTPIFEIDKSTEALSLGQAVARVAA